MEERGSFIKMQGKMGNLSFDKHHKHGYATWMKGSVDVNHIAPDPEFQRTWGNNAELGRAASTSSKIKQQINNLLLDYGDSQFSNQLPSVMHKIPWDERKSLQANNLMLKNMEMNIAAKRFIMENGNLYLNLFI